MSLNKKKDNIYFNLSSLTLTHINMGHVILKQFVFVTFNKITNYHSFTSGFILLCNVHF